ncbi:MAG: hypothetical protein IJV29_01035 [Butyrivibrio sp.]|jgi:hypothetical protein|nr:hypothetical protein [Butyrivibrio sp.]
MYGYNNDREADIALYIGNFVRRTGYVPTVGNMINDLGFLYVMASGAYIIQLIILGMLNPSYLVAQPMLSMKSNLYDK